MGDQMKDEIMAQITAMAGEGLRTIGIAYCSVQARARRACAHARRYVQAAPPPPPRPAGSPSEAREEPRPLSPRSLPRPRRCA